MESAIQFESAQSVHSGMRNVGNVIDEWQDVTCITVTPPVPLKKSLKLHLSFLNRPGNDGLPVLPLADMPAASTPPMRRREANLPAAGKPTVRTPSADPDRLMPRRRFPHHVAPEVMMGSRYLMGVSGASSILTPRYIVDETTAEEANSPSAEELNKVLRQSDPKLAKSKTVDGSGAGSGVVGAGGADMGASSADVAVRSTSEPAIGGGGSPHVYVTLLQSTRPSMLSVDGGVPLYSRAVCSPLSRVIGRPTRVVQAVINIDCSGMYESLISPYDCRDHVYESANSADCTIPLGLRLPTHVRNDGSRHGGMHVALHMTLMLEINTGAACPALSPAFLYYNRRCRPIHGMHGRDALRIMTKIGVAECSAYSWSGDDYYAPPISEESYRTARRHRVNGYYAVVSAMGLKSALADAGVCYILLPLFGIRPRFWCADIRAAGPVRVTEVQSALVMGYDERGFMLTIWDPSWVGDRTVWFSYDDWSSVIECWAAYVDKGALRAGDVIGSMICGRGVATADMASADSQDMTIGGDDDTRATVSPAFVPAEKITTKRPRGCVLL